MKLYEAQVVENGDLSERGKILVYCPKLSENLISVIYTSPYAAGWEGGFIAIPEVGEQVLICQPDESISWYYQSTIISTNPALPTIEESELIETDNLLPDSDIYKARGVPQKIVLKDTRGNQLSLKALANNKFLNIGAELKSSVGKKLLLSDSPKMDCVILRNEHGDGIKITSSADPVSPARALELHSRGPQKFISRESQIDLIVKEGRECNITNESTGLNRNSAEPEKYGNINISSKNKDINLTVFEEDGKVFIDALGSNGIIQIDSGNKITIWATDNIEIRSGKDIKLKSDSKISIESGSDINIKSGGNLNLDASRITNIRSDSNVNIDGSQVHLNSGSSSPANGTDVQKLNNSYGN
jgi:hypothetical protein